MPSFASPYQYINEVRGSIRKRGVLRTVRVLWSEIAFDWKYGTQTVKLAALDSLQDIQSSNKAFGVDYQGVNAWLFARAMTAAIECADLDPAAFGRMGFVDFGSGRGRALLLAALRGFGQVTGIDFSATLCEDARKNWNLLQAKNSTVVGSSVEVICADATQVQLDSSMHVFFLFNPFGPPVLAEVAARIRESLESSPRPHAIIYIYPLHAHVFEAAGFRNVASVGSSGVTPDAAVYTLS